MSITLPKVYGDVLAGGPVDVRGYFRKPLVICRLFSLVMSIVVFSTLASGGTHEGYCILDRRASNCNFVVFIGVAAMLCALALLAADFAMPHISSINSRKNIVITDIALACLFTLLWLVCTGVIIGEWWRTPVSDLVGVPSWQFSCIQASASFSIFSIAIWALITFFATKRFNLGKTELFDFPGTVNYADNKNFDSIPGGTSSVVSGGANYSQFEPQPFSVSSQVNDGAQSHRNAVVY